MKINRNNYEVFLIDYIEGKLDARREAELELFLEANPDIKEEFAEFENISLQTDDISFAEKEKLKKVPIQKVAGIEEKNYEHFFIAYCEGDLSSQMQTNLMHFLAVNAQLKAEFEIHKHLKTESDQAIVYPQHEELKKKPVVALWWWSSGAVAATVALFFALFNLLNSDGIVSEKQVFSIVHLDSKSGTELINNPSKVQLATRTPRLVQIMSTVNEQEQLTAEFEKIDFATIDRKLFALKLNDDSHKGEPLQTVQSIEVMTLANNEPIQKEKKKNIFSRILKRQVELLADKSPVKKKKKDKSGDPTFVRILDSGITAFNTVTGSEVEMNKAYNKEGELTGYQVEGDALSLNRSIPNPDKGE